MKKVFTPFWSYDVEKTEEWLSFMAAQGFVFIKFNPWSRKFYFEEGTPKQMTYTIGFDKTFGVLPTALADEGWQEVFNHRNWYVIANEKPVEDIKSEPVREGIINHNRKIMYIYGGILFYMIFTSLFPIFMTALMLFSADGTITIHGSPMWFVTIIVSLIIWSLTIYSTVKIYKTNKRLGAGTAKPAFDTSINRLEEKELKKSGRMIVKRKIGWMYGPDKLEKWLESMEEQGFHLYRVNKAGITFFFIKGNPRKVSYCADYQNTTNQGYFDMHREAGWQLMYTNHSLLNKWSIWAQAYKEREVRPELYSDSEHMLRHARRVAITYSALYIPLLVLYIGIIILNINLAAKYGVDKTDVMMFIIFGLVLVEFGIFIIKSLCYYKRVKKDVSQFS
ncbi:DUF2812 domain-containing protein [Virgibacillus ainsalahensis]